ncbi:DUF2551 domain-containing protein [Methermicoccus shengliensis]|uniref:DUF2551 domain-containing protein n=1 Tax=Methermicoccus shengliensis TaxID=660064 RepID=A0A832RWN2_9EURY|nr:DUF2551 domain-containing protein [Methermicoccus shengliensis]KUK05270.1 MAG: hypothetical protein XD46_0263 [Euryarchaeota archaeon 55_53]KUK30315.1 MAG: hypothetical protein XD62_0578 [Methanosarcinales archeaon 56_1174]MDI3487857.1 hypothetical protein [Methanosarcinales archaeon]MDN5294496.1 hypothetical protein [Methanosarcinales archaeon]HIH69774.1 DUF2551 domain-containing protein [Methermicoccus shengliensis]
MSGNEELLQRLMRYVGNDPRGIRRAVLESFACGEELTTEHILTQLGERGMCVSKQSVNSMVGLLASRMGLLRVSTNGKRRSYALKAEYMELLRGVLEQL